MFEALDGIGDTPKESQSIQERSDSSEKDVMKDTMRYALRGASAVYRLRSMEDSIRPKKSNEEGNKAKERARKGLKGGNCQPATIRGVCLEGLSIILTNLVY